jgi:DNA processing protein
MPSAIPDSLWWVALAAIPGVGGETFRKLLQAFGPPEEIFATPRARLAGVVKSEIADAVSRAPDFDALQSTREWLASPGNALLTLADEAYPARLLEIPDPPPLLYAKGRLELLHGPALAVVGSRNATPQGIRNAESFAESLSGNGWRIISGMALGIDAAAHVGALCGPGSTIAVVGTGLDIVYPARNRDLAHRIAREGLLLSEQPIGMGALASNFPRRNRLISGLAQGCLVVEAAARSGSLITARQAAEQGREVFAIPGSIHSPLAKGCHQLIKQGAKLVESAQDILEEFGSPAPSPAPLKTATADESQSFAGLSAHLGHDPVSIDQLVERSGLTAENVSAMLLHMELDGLVATVPGGLYQRLT